MTDISARPRQGYAPMGESGVVNPDDLPAYSLILSTVRAVTKPGGSARAREITTQVLEDQAPTDDMLAVGHANPPDASV